MNLTGFVFVPKSNRNSAMRLSHHKTDLLQPGADEEERTEGMALLSDGDLFEVFIAHFIV